MKAFLGFLLFLFPVVAGAAGFSSQALFLSKTPVTEGETVLVHVVIANDSATTFEGKVGVRSATSTIGTVPAILKSGEARTVSISWSPKAGEYTLVAELVGEDGSIVASEKAAFTVAPKPQTTAPEAPQQTTVDSSTQIQQAIAKVSEPLAQGSKPVFETLDSLRATGADFLDKQIATSKERLTEGRVLGESTEQSWGQSASTIFETFYLYLLTLLRHILASAAYFYPLLAIVFLYILWRLYRRMSSR